MTPSAQPSGLAVPTSRRTLLTGALGTAGLVGLGGWGASSASATSAGLYAKIHAIDASCTGMLAVAVSDRRSGAVWQYNAAQRNQTASIVKVLILASVCYRAQSAKRSLSAWEKAQATSMIRNSDNTAAINLFTNVGGAKVVQAMAARLGMSATRVDVHWGLTTTSAYDQLVLMNELTWHGRVLNAGNRSYILGLMGTVSAGQRWGVGTYGTTQVKNGWLPVTGGWLVNSIGHVTGGGRDYTLAILQRGLGSMGTGTNAANRVALTIYNQLARPL